MKQKLKLLTAFLCGAIFFSSISYAATELKARVTDYKVTLNGIEMKELKSPISIDGSTYLPVRSFAESLGYLVRFHDGKISIELPNGNSPTSQSIKDNIFDLSDRSILDAIAIGKAGYDNVVEFNNNQKLNIKEATMNFWQPNVWAHTPMTSVARESYLKNRKGESYNLADAKKLVSLMQYFVIELQTFGVSKDYAKEIKVYMKQEGILIQPKLINGNEDQAVRSSFAPTPPQYQNVLLVYFDLEKIDFSKEAQLVYVYDDEGLSITYTIDFSKLK